MHPLQRIQTTLRGRSNASRRTSLVSCHHASQLPRGRTENCLRNFFRGPEEPFTTPEYSHSHASEKKFADLVRQLVFGLGHGLISILGLSIGVASATGSTRTVAIAGVVGMLTGLAALVTLEFLSARTQKQIYQHMIEEEKTEFAEHPEVEKTEMRQYYIDEGFTGEEADSFVNRLSLDKERWLKAHVTHILEFIPGKTVSPARESITLGLSHLLGATDHAAPVPLAYEPELRSLWLDTTCFNHALRCRGAKDKSRRGEVVRERGRVLGPWDAGGCSRLPGRHRCGWFGVAIVRSESESQ